MLKFLTISKEGALLTKKTRGLNLAPEIEPGWSIGLL